MARFRCAACNRDSEFVYDPTRHVCPLCGSSDVVFALTIDELPDEVFEALAKTGSLDDDETDEG
jgi:hypothetical protein